jgi:hypothetical protein
VKGEMLKDQFQFHVIPSTAEPLVHISKNERAEIVFFGQDIPLKNPQGLFAGKEIIVTAPDAEQIKISRFTPGQDDQVVYTDTNLASVVAAIVEIGGSYSDVVQLLHEAKKTGALDVRVAVDALPKADRIIYREEKGVAQEESNDSEDTNDSLINASSNPDLASEIEETYVDPEFSPETKKGFWSKMTNWWSSSPQ